MISTSNLKELQIAYGAPALIPKSKLVRPTLHGMISVVPWSKEVGDILSWRTTIYTCG